LNWQRFSAGTLLPWTQNFSFLHGYSHLLQEYLVVFAQKTRTLRSLETLRKGAWLKWQLSILPRTIGPHLSSCQAKPSICPWISQGKKGTSIKTLRQSVSCNTAQMISIRLGASARDTLAWLFSEHFPDSHQEIFCKGPNSILIMLITGLGLGCLPLSRLCDLTALSGWIAFWLLASSALAWPFHVSTRHHLERSTRRMLGGFAKERLPSLHVANRDASTRPQIGKPKR